MCSGRWRVMPIISYQLLECALWLVLPTGSVDIRNLPRQMCIKQWAAGLACELVCLARGAHTLGLAGTRFGLRLRANWWWGACPERLRWCGIVSGCVRGISAGLAQMLRGASPGSCRADWPSVGLPPAILGGPRQSRVRSMATRAPWGLLWGRCRVPECSHGTL